MSKNKLPSFVKLISICVIAIAFMLSSCGPRGADLETLDPTQYDQSWLTGNPLVAHIIPTLAPILINPAKVQDLRRVG
jgi:hypothetical protein